MLVSDLFIVTTFEAVIVVAFLVHRVLRQLLVFALFANVLGCVDLRG